MKLRHFQIAHAAGRLEAILYRGGWPARLARALGVRPTVRTTRHAIAINHGAVATPPLTLAYASDFHAGPTTDRSVLLAACAALRAATPDVLLLGGDFVTVVPAEIDWLAAELGRIPATLGRFAVLGNHDWWSDVSRIVKRLEGAGIQVLTNRNVRLEPPFGDVWICGIDDHLCGHPDAAAALSGADGIRIVLMHAPSGLLNLAGERFDLALCGHTHGGQLALPGGVPIVVPGGRLSRRYARGRFAVENGQTLVVSVGLGCVVLPFRLFADPEIVVCNLTVAASQ
ncbi:MAG: metallophosphoesterase family protein [Gemmatimonadales bacterium]|nr:metallophosphoesterase family protein [Gemmatimonadales bacterium]